MSKHIIDSPRDRSGSSKFVQFVRIEANSKPQPQTKQLQQRPQPGNAPLRTRHFLEIDRRNA